MANVAGHSIRVENLDSAVLLWLAPMRAAAI